MTAANETEIALERKRKTGTRWARQARPTRTTIMIGSSTSIRWERDEACESHGADVEIDPSFHQRSSHVTLSHVTPSHDTLSHATPSQLTDSQEMPSQEIPSHARPGLNTFPLAARSRRSTRDGRRSALTRAGRTVSASSTSRPGV